MIFFFRYGTIYRQVLKIPKTDVCWILAKSSSNPLINAIIDIFRKTDTSLIHECPYTQIILDNKPIIVETLPSVFSAGDYKFTIELLAKDDKSILYVETLVYWFSSEKNSFG
jgi:hypothetical protein